MMEIINSVFYVGTKGVLTLVGEGRGTEGLEDAPRRRRTERN